MRKYGWPIVLFMVVPLTANIVRPADYYALDSGFLSYDSFLMPAVLQGLTAAILLGVLYLWVRSDERATLRLVWSCTLMLAITTALVYLSAMLAGYDSLASMAVVGTLNVLVDFVLLLWFARQASRLGLAHAFFFVIAAGGLTLHNYYYYLPLYFGWLLGLATSVLAVWLLANFDLRGHTFQRRSAIVVVALTGLTGVGYLRFALDASREAAVMASFFLPMYVFFLPVYVTFFLLLLLPLLVYLVRVRQPATGIPPAPLSPV